MPKLEKLRQIQELQNPALRTQRMFSEMMQAEAVARMDFYKGEPGAAGATPVRGKDYFTEEDTQAFLDHIHSRVFAEHIQKQIKPGKNGAPGLPGRPGRDAVGIQGPPGLKGKDGITPVRGVHYWTEEDKMTIAKAILKATPQIDEKKLEKMVEWRISESMKNVPNNESVLVSILKDPRLRMLLHGSGGTSSSSGGTGDAWKEVDLTSSVNGVNTVFTLPDTPVAGSLSLILGGSTQVPNAVDYTLAIATATFVYAPPMLNSTTPTRLFARYQTLSSGKWKGWGALTGTVNGVNTVFTLSDTPVAGSLSVVLGGALEVGGGVDYTLLGTTVTFANAPTVQPYRNYQY